MKFREKERKYLDFAVLPCWNLFLKSPEKNNEILKLRDLFKELSDQTNIILKNKNILFFHELRNFMNELKNSAREKNWNDIQKIENFIENQLNLILIENEHLCKYLESINLFDLSPNQNYQMDELMKFKAEVESSKAHIEDLKKKNLNLETYLENFVNKPDHEINSGLKKTIQKLISLEKKNEHMESQQQNFIQQINLLKQENLKLFVKIKNTKVFNI